MFFVTGNQGKIKEVTRLLRDVTPIKLDILEIQGSIEDIVKFKCDYAIAQLNKMGRQGSVLVEDTALYFNAMKQLPGVYVKYFLENLGPKGMVRMLDGFEDKSATAVTVYAYKKDESSPVVLFRGETQGTIVLPEGDGGFGWDPIFKTGDKTYAEMTVEEKNLVSHRAKALAKLVEYLEAQPTK